MPRPDPLPRHLAGDYSAMAKRLAERFVQLHAEVVDPDVEDLGSSMAARLAKKWVERSRTP